MFIMTTIYPSVKRDVVTVFLWYTLLRKLHFLLLASLWWWAKLKKLIFCDHGFGKPFKISIAITQIKLINFITSHLGIELLNNYFLINRFRWLTYFDWQVMFGSLLVTWSHLFFPDWLLPVQIFDSKLLIGWFGFRYWSPPSCLLFLLSDNHVLVFRNANSVNISCTLFYGCFCVLWLNSWLDWWQIIWLVHWFSAAHQNVLWICWT